VEGCYRFQYAISSHDVVQGSGAWSGSDSTSNPLFPPVLLLLGGLFEICFASMGLWVGLGHYFFNMSSGFLTNCLLLQQLVLGVFTYLVWTLAYPAFNDDRLSGFDNIDTSFFSHDEAHGARVFGQIITGMCWCGVLQSAQFMFALALSRVQSTTQTDKYNAESYKLRMAFFATLIFVSGLSTLIIGGLFHDHDGKGNYAGPWYYFPNVVAYSELTIISGLILIVFGLFAFLVIIKQDYTQHFIYFGIIVWIWLLCLHNMAQLGKAALPVWPYAYLWERTGMTSYMICLTTSLVLTPLYLASRLSGNYSAVASQ